MKIKVAFVDRDGTIAFEPPDTFQINGVEQLKILPGVIEGLQELKDRGFQIVMVTNQDGLGTPSNPTDNFETVQRELLGRLHKEEIQIHSIFVCPHLKEEECLCRKPLIGMVKKFLYQYDIDFEESIMIGNSEEADGGFAKNLGVKFFKMETNGSFPIIPWLARDLAWEFCQKRRGGENPSMQEYTKQLPDIKDLEEFESLVEMDEIGSHMGNFAKVSEVAEKANNPPHNS